MPVLPFRRMRPGQPLSEAISASDENRLRGVVEALAKATSGSGDRVDSRAGAPVVYDDSPPWIMVRIVSGTNPYAFVEARDDGAGTFYDLAEGVSGTAYELTGNTAVPTGTHTWARLADDRLHWLFFYPAGGGSGGPSPGDISNCWPSYGAALDADQNDYAPSSLLWWRLSRGSSPANVNITGITAGDDGCPILITHAGRTGSTGAFAETITLKNQSASSAAGNRIIVSDYEGFGDRVLHSGESVLLRYDFARGRWRVIELPAASATQPGTVSLLAQSMGAGAKYFSDKVGIGTTSPLANSALDVRTGIYVYFAGIISFGGGGSPSSETAGAILQYDGSAGAKNISLTIAALDYVSGKVGGVQLQGTNTRFVVRHKSAAGRKFAWFNDDTAAYDDGVTGTYTRVTTTGGIVTGGTLTSTITGTF